MKTKRWAFLTVAFFALLHPLLAFSQQTQQPPLDWHGPWHMWGGGFWWIFPFFMLFMLIICVAIFFLGHRLGGCGHHHWGPWQMMNRPSEPGRSDLDPTHSAIQILNERFARGEIQTQEYEEKKAAILSSGKR